MQIPVGKDNEAAVLGTGILAGLLLGGKRILVLGLGLEDDEWEASGIKEEEVHEPFCGFLEVVAERVEIG